ncbi:nucleotide-sugar transporter-domain-containing protein [Tricharina praecox]|uniref:nucleotide-sugar transporter-domain-containing protein n=1 Tax=Tricharina praecox TaxID=43433 RepID=UPI0022201EDD|nr:nucleotide-sugar transporter-domain-containing protein [Tricharina praecox]KAI5859058.1 nucleotide-sugar transporter-domain-containing protein [Tricharina praecox]
MVAEAVPTFLGVPMRLVSLATLTVQNSALILIMHYSRIMPMTGSNRYLASTAVLLNEVLKLALCLAVAFRDRRKIDGSMSSLSTTVQNLSSEIFRRDSWKLAIPACLYTIQNSLQYVAVSNLDAAAFQVTYQLKILTTAIFSVTLLHRRLDATKWLSLITLTAGVAIVQLPSPSSAPDTDHAHHHHNHRSATYQGIVEEHAMSTMDPAKGLTAVVIACMISGLAGVYFEKVLKGSSTSLWIRNVQLSVWSLLPATIGVVFMDGAQIMERGFFEGYNDVVWTAIVFQAFGGIIVALCVNFADNIAKNFATSISILISCIASVYFFDFVVTINFIVGAVVVLFATWLYSKPDSAPQYAPVQNSEPETAAVEEIEFDVDMEKGRRGSGAGPKR